MNGQELYSQATGNCFLHPGALKNLEMENRFDANAGGIDIRVAQPQDFFELVNLLAGLDRETPYLGYVPGERSSDFLNQQKTIIDDSSGAKGVMFLARSGAKPVGMLQAQVFPLQRLRHVVNIEIGILQAYSGLGIGAQLFRLVEVWARARRLHRLTLTVASNNQRALALYSRCGFSIEGVMHHAMLLDGEYVDDYVMAKLLD